MHGGRRVGIIGGVRIPFARADTAYAGLGNLDLMTAALKGLSDRYGLAGQRLGDAAMGAVLKHPADYNLAREAVQAAGLSPLTPAFDLQRACGTSLEAAILLGAKIATGQIECGIAGGCDSISDAPLTYPRAYQRILVASSRGRSLGERVQPWLGLRPRHFVPVLPAVVEPLTGLSMGESCELMVKDWAIGREPQDRWAAESHRKAADAWDRGFFDDLVTPCAGLSRDNNLRPDAGVEKLASLPPSFDAGGTGTLTAGNSTPLTDGAAAVLVASEQWAAERGLGVEAWLSHGRVAAVDYAAGEGLLMAPTVAVSEMLKAAALTLQDFDVYEIHEAFAGQVLCTLAAWESERYCHERLGRSRALGPVPRERINPVGSSLAVGHPFAATGARILGTLSRQLVGNGGRGLISVCTAGGMGVSAILEAA